MNRAASTRIDAHQSEAVSLRAPESPRAEFLQPRELSSPSKRLFRSCHGNCNEYMSDYAVRYDHPPRETGSLVG